jgi:hypothetical protein
MQTSGREDEVLIRTSLSVGAAIGGWLASCKKQISHDNALRSVHEPCPTEVIVHTQDRREHPADREPLPSPQRNSLTATACAITRAVPTGSTAKPLRHPPASPRRLDEIMRRAALSTRRCRVARERECVHACVCVRLHPEKSGGPPGPGCTSQRPCRIFSKTACHPSGERRAAGSELGISTRYDTHHLPRRHHGGAGRGYICK